MEAYVVMLGMVVLQKSPRFLNLGTIVARSLVGKSVVNRAWI